MSRKTEQSELRSPENRPQTGAGKFDPSIGKATQFKPGQSGNPGGRPKNDWAKEIARAVFENNAEAVYGAMLKVLLKGNPHVFKELADRAYGKTVSRHEFAGPDGGPLNLSYAEMTTEELDAEIKRLTDELGLVPKREMAGE